MPQRKPWSAEEDTLLKNLRDEENISKWSLIAKKMTEEYHMPGRTGKQCRQRYHNHLDSTILRSEWNEQEQKYLYHLHDQIGNKWAIIAQKLPGRTDNCVKNHFYSKMRKAIRKLNKVIHIHFKKEIKEIKLNVLYKLVQATDQKFKINPVIDEQISDRCCELKNQLLEFANDDEQQQIQDIQKIQKLYQLARSIHQVSSRYRKRPKRSRRNSAHGPQVASLAKFSPKYRSANSDNQFQSESDEDIDDDHHEISIKGRFTLQSVKQQVEQKQGAYTVPSYLENQNFQMKFQQEQEMQIQKDEQKVNNDESFSDNSFNNYNDIDIENSLLTPRLQNMLSDDIQRLNLGNDYNLNQIQAGQYDERII